MKSKKINYPIVLKPINEGSSLGVEICKNKEKLFRSSRYLFQLKKLSISLKKYNKL